MRAARVAAGAAPRSPARRGRRRSRPSLSARGERPGARGGSCGCELQRGAVERGRARPGRASLCSTARPLRSSSSSALRRVGHRVRAAARRARARPARVAGLAQRALQREGQRARPAGPPRRRAGSSSSGARRRALVLIRRRRRGAARCAGARRRRARRCGARSSARRARSPARMRSSSLERDEVAGLERQHRLAALRGARGLVEAVQVEARQLQVRGDLARRASGRPGSRGRGPRSAPSRCPGRCRAAPARAARRRGPGVRRSTSW